VIPSNVYRLVCNFRGERLGLNGRKLNDDQDDIIFPDENGLPDHDGWHAKELTMRFPTYGAWKILFCVIGKCLARQMVLVGEGSRLQPTKEERIALAAVVP
jgi:hypothetical protein